MFFNKEKENPKTKESLLKEAYRYLSEYILVLEYHETHKTSDKEKINKIKELKENINKLI